MNEDERRGCQLEQAACLAAADPDAQDQEWEVALISWATGGGLAALVAYAGVRLPQPGDVWGCGTCRKPVETMRMNRATIVVEHTGPGVDRWCSGSGTAAERLA